MSIGFKESQSSLSSRIKIHDLYGSANLDHWVLKKLEIKPNEKIIDLGCGDGKQCFAIKNNLSKSGIKIIGLDEHEDLIKIAKNKNNQNDIKFEIGDFDGELSFSDNSFDLVISCFAIYYAENIVKTLSEIKRVLKKNGRIFFTGPMPNNKIEFNEVVEEAANSKIPKLIGSSRFSSEIFLAVSKNFQKAKIDQFTNVLNFKNIEPFMEYTASALEKNRNVYDEFLKNKDLNVILKKIEGILKEKIKANGNLKITKLVGGISAYNSID